MTDPDLLDGAIDMHVHTAPDLIERFESDVDLARDAREAGMRAILVKSHVVPTAGRVDLVNEAVGDELLFGGVACNGGVGGLNRDAVEAALELGAKVVWLPTAWSANHASQARESGVERFVGHRVPDEDEEIPVARDGEVTPATRQVMDLVDEYDAVLGTGHAAPDEIETVAEACADAGVDCLVNHPCFRVVDVSLERQERLAELGAVMEYCAYAVQTTEGHTIERVAEAVERVGPENAVLATDFGQAENPPVPGLREFAEAVVDAGVPRETVRQCLTETPVRLLRLD
ncbi:DUF6282 family protein [Haloarchaeobius sp. HME9146]|uniref:DUF6282 family protein n=1 Tax=Haloarchaeobius sp. HME9146 TaxID=2978732 RepID=UPI0021C22FE0|nr:DUF6282 family protein [Haloarchaeobius sp. HME9146]MCT9095574.1 DUF6282 family protein [Haloarchaeobius sp. HME9146]